MFRNSALKEQQEIKAVVYCHSCGKEYKGCAPVDCESDGWYKAIKTKAHEYISECPDCHGE